MQLLELSTTMNSSNHTNAQSREHPFTGSSGPMGYALHSPGRLQKLPLRETLVPFIATLPAYYSGRYAYHHYCLECANANVSSVSLRTFYRHLKAYRQHVSTATARRHFLSSSLTGTSPRRPVAHPRGSS